MEGGGVVPAVDQQHGVGVTVVVPGDRLESLRSGGVPDRKLSKDMFAKVSQIENCQKKTKS